MYAKSLEKEQDIAYNDSRWDEGVHDVWAFFYFFSTVRECEDSQLKTGSKEVEVIT